MIRPSDLTSASAWLRPLATPPRADARDAPAFFDVDALTSPTRISSDLCTAARGLSVDQHAARVLSHMCAESNESV
jgi:hypothetical protein